MDEPATRLAPPSLPREQTIRLAPSLLQRVPTIRLAPSLLLLYGLAAFEAQLPDTAVTERLNAHVGLARQQAIFATGFSMSALKMVWGALIDAAARRFGGSKLIFVAACCGAAACHLWLASCESANAIFSAYVALSAFQACAEMVLSTRLAAATAPSGDQATSRGVAAATAQGSATAARWTGSLVSSVTTLILYRCGRAAPRPHAVLRATALLPILAAAVAIAEATPREATPPRKPVRPALVALVVLAQASVVWVGLRETVENRDAWPATLVTLVGTTLALGLVSLRRAPPGPDEPDAFAEQLLAEIAEPPVTSLTGEEPAPSATPLYVFAAPLLLFALEAAPSAAETLSNVAFWLFFDAKPCYTQYLGLGSTVASLLACGFYRGVSRRADASDRGGRWLRWPTTRFVDPTARFVDSRVALAIAVPAAALASLARVPLAGMRPYGGGAAGRRRVAGLGRFDYALGATCLDAFFGELVVLAATTLALSRAADADAGTRGFAYGAYLSTFDAGASVSAWINAGLLSRLDIRYGEWGHVPLFVRICAAASIAPLGLLFVP